MLDLFSNHSFRDSFLVSFSTFSSLEIREEVALLLGFNIFKGMLLHLDSFFSTTAHHLEVQASVGIVSMYHIIYT
jgi:hypothetical protein